jgi:hypothetical protein
MRLSTRSERPDNAADAYVRSDLSFPPTLDHAVELSEPDGDVEYDPDDQ